VPENLLEPGQGEPRLDPVDAERVAEVVDPHIVQVGRLAAFPEQLLRLAVGERQREHRISRPARPADVKITQADVLDRVFGIETLAKATLPAFPGDGAALPQIVASLGSTGNVLARIAASLSTIRPDATSEAQAGQRETNVVLTRLAELLAKAKIGQSFSGDIILQIENDGKDSPQLALDIRRALEDLSMADFGRTDRWGQT
jgi:hypothetical protein